MGAAATPRSGPGDLRRARRSAAAKPSAGWRRPLWLAATILLLALALDVGLDYSLGRGTSSQVHSLGLTLSRYQREGVPPASLAGARRELGRAKAGSWISLPFLPSPQAAALASARSSAQRALGDALRSHRRAASQALARYRLLVENEAGWLSPAQAAASSDWGRLLARARTPAQFETLARSWGQQLSQATQSATLLAHQAAAR